MYLLEWVASMYRRIAPIITNRMWRPEDDRHMRARKAILLISSSVVMTIVGAHQVQLYFKGLFLQDGYGLFWLYSTWNVVYHAMVLVYLFVWRQCGDFFFAMTIAMEAMQVMLFDLFQASGMGVRASPTFIILVDMMLIGHMPTMTSFVLVAFMMIWIVLVEIEHFMRFGLLDLWGTQTLDDRQSRCGCEQPPCAVPWAKAWTGIQISLFVFCLDIIFTRRFAVGVEAERTRVEAAVVTSRDVAAALARFDLDAAEASLRAQGEILPKELLRSFKTLVDNLGTYKPYLPQSCLPIDDEPRCDATRTHDLDSTQSSESDTQRRSASVSSSQGLPAPLPTTAARPGAIRDNFLKAAKISLVNMNAHLQPGPPGRYAEQHEIFIAHVVQHINAGRGVVDSFLADRVTASFNAARMCGTHAKAAIGAVRAVVCDLEGMSLTGAVGSGMAMVGVLGTDTMRRQSIVGDLPAAVDQLDRYGEVRRYAWVCNRSTYGEAWMEESMRIILDRVTGFKPEGRKAGEADAESVVYELMMPKRTLVQDLAESIHEWMYQLERGAGKEWEMYNEAGARYLLPRQQEVDSYEAALKILEIYKVPSEQLTLFKHSVAAARTVHLHPQIAAREADFARCRSGVESSVPTNIPSDTVELISLDDSTAVSSGISSYL